MCLRTEPPPSDSPRRRRRADPFFGRASIEAVHHSAVWRASTGRTAGATTRTRGEENKDADSDTAPTQGQDVDRLIPVRKDARVRATTPARSTRDERQTESHDRFNSATGSFTDKTHTRRIFKKARLRAETTLPPRPPQDLRHPYILEGPAGSNCPPFLPPSPSLFLPSWGHKRVFLVRGVGG